MARLAKESSLGKLLDTLPSPGIVSWLSIRPVRLAPVHELKEVEAIESRGLAGDHYKGIPSSTRQVTLIQAEHLEAIASFLGKEVNPALLRRNIMIKGINLLALKDKRFKIGDAIMEMTGLCHPCSRMEEALGEGGYNAMRGHGGITAKILKSGMIRLGDQVYIMSET